MASKTPTPTLESLGAKVAELSKEITAQLKAANHPEPSFAADSPPALPHAPNVNLPRMQLVELLTDMLQLACGPNEWILEKSFQFNHDPWILDSLDQFDFYGAVPLDRSATYAEIAKHTRLPEVIVRRLLRYAMQHHLFTEETPGSDRVLHTATTAQLTREPQLRAITSHCMEEVRAACSQQTEALKKWFQGTTEATEEAEHCGWTLGYLEGKPLNGEPFWSFIDSASSPGKLKGWRATRFAEAMQGISKSFVVGYDVVLDQYDWDALGEATVIDLGGSAGHVSVLVAEKHPKLKFIVQDLPNVEPAFKANIPAALAPRISFQAHDFFKPEETPAEAYLIKSVLHDWPDKYCIKILSNLVPKLRKGDRIIIFDGILPPALDAQGKPTLPLQTRKLLYAVDLQMHVFCNAKERTVEDWVSVAKRTDGRLALKSVHVVPGQPLGIIEFVLEG